MRCGRGGARHLRRGEADGEEDRGAARDDALAGENCEDSGGVLRDGEEHGRVAVVLEAHGLVGGVARVARGEGEAAVGEERFRYEVLAARSEGVAARGEGEAPRQSERLLSHESEGSHRLERTKRLEGLGVVLPVGVRAELHLERRRRLWKDVRLKRRHREHGARLARVRVRDHPLDRHLTVSAVEEADRLLLADPKAGEER